MSSCFNHFCLISKTCMRKPEISNNLIYSFFSLVNKISKLILHERKVIEIVLLGTVRNDPRINFIRKGKYRRN